MQVQICTGMLTRLQLESGLPTKCLPISQICCVTQVGIGYHLVSSSCIGCQIISFFPFGFVTAQHFTVFACAQYLSLNSSTTCYFSGQNEGSLFGNIGRERTGFLRRLETFIAGLGYCIGFDREGVGLKRESLLFSFAFSVRICLLLNWVYKQGC